jgi:transposase-like protein
MKPTFGTEDTGAGQEKRRRRHCGAAQRKRYLELFEKSGLSAVEFCREHGLHKQTLYNWRHKARRAGSAGAASGPRFAEVAVTTAAASDAAGGICIRLAGDVSVEAGVGTDAGWLARVIYELRALR